MCLLWGVGERGAKDLGCSRRAPHAACKRCASVLCLQADEQTAQEGSGSVECCTAADWLAQLMVSTVEAEWLFTPHHRAQVHDTLGACSAA